MEIDQTISKSNEMVRAHRTNAISTDAQKIFGFILSKINSNTTEDEHLRVYRHELVSWDGAFRNEWVAEEPNIAFKIMKTKFDELRNIVISPADGSDRWASVLIGAYEFNDDGSYVDFKIPDVLQRHLIQLKQQFTTYYLDMVLGLTGTKYTLTMYEILRSYLHKGQREYTVTISVDTLRKNLGAAADSYQKFKEFKRSVIDPSIKEINQNDVSDIRCTYVTDRRRPIKNITFTIFAVDQFQQMLKDQTQLTGIPESTKEILDEIGFNPIGKGYTFLMALIDSHGENVLNQALQVVVNWEDKKARAKMAWHLLPQELLRLTNIKEQADDFKKNGLAPNVAHSAAVAAIQTKEENRKGLVLKFSREYPDNWEAIKNEHLAPPFNTLDDKIVALCLYDEVDKWIKLQDWANEQINLKNEFQNNS